MQTEAAYSIIYHVVAYPNTTIKLECDDKTRFDTAKTAIENQFGATIEKVQEYAQTQIVY